MRIFRPDIAKPETAEVIRPAEVEAIENRNVRKLLIDELHYGSAIQRPRRARVSHRVKKQVFVAIGLYLSEETGGVLPSAGGATRPNLARDETRNEVRLGLLPHIHRCGLNIS